MYKRQVQCIGVSYTELVKCLRKDSVVIQLVINLLLREKTLRHLCRLKYSESPNYCSNKSGRKYLVADLNIRKLCMYMSETQDETLKKPYIIDITILDLEVLEWMFGLIV